MTLMIMIIKVVNSTNYNSDYINISNYNSLNDINLHK